MFFLPASAPQWLLYWCLKPLWPEPTPDATSEPEINSESNLINIMYLPNNWYFLQVGQLWVFTFLCSSFLLLSSFLSCCSELDRKAIIPRSMFPLTETTWGTDLRPSRHWKTIDTACEYPHKKDGITKARRPCYNVLDCFVVTDKTQQSRFLPIKTKLQSQSFETKTGWAAFSKVSILELPKRQSNVDVGRGFKKKTHKCGCRLQTEAAKQNSAIINVIIYTSAFPTVMCQNVFYEKCI